MENKAFIAKQINRFFQIMSQKMELDEETSMEIADLYEPWEANKAYGVGKILKHGKNSNGETQLYAVVQEHTSQDTWTPDTAPSLYKKIGFTDSGIPVWTQPLGAEDAYNLGDLASHKEQIWESEVDNNVWEPGVYGWKVKK